MLIRCVTFCAARKSNRPQFARLYVEKHVRTHLNMKQDEAGAKKWGEREEPSPQKSPGLASTFSLIVPMHFVTLVQKYFLK